MNIFPEIQDCVTRFGKRPIEFMADIGILGDHLLLHHATLVTDREIELLSASNTPVSYNPLASIWKGNAGACTRLSAAGSKIWHWV